MYRKVLNYLRGQVTVEVESAAPERVLNLCAAHGIPFWGLTWLSEIRLRAAIDRAELPRLREVLTRTDAVLTVVRTEGAPEVWRQYRRRYVLLAAAAVLAGGWLAIQAAPKPQAADTPAVQTAASAAAPVRTIGYTLVPLPQTDEKEAVAPADDPAAEEAPEEAPAPEEAVAPEDDAAGDPNAVPDDLELLDTFLATAYCQTGTTATGTYTTVGRTLAVNPGVIPYGTHVWLYLEDGTLVGDYYAEDTGGNMLEHPYVIDIYMGTDYDTCIEWGVKRVSVYVEKDAGS